MPNGYTGQILHIDLSNRNIIIEKPPAEFYRRYLGGSAQNLWSERHLGMSHNKSFKRDWA